MSGAATRPAPAPAELAALVDERFERSATATERFFDGCAERVPHVCLAMAERFRRGGRLIAFGAGAAASDARHVSVEFVHPVLVGKRALPALALDASSPDSVSRALRTLARVDDMALAISPGPPGPAVAGGLAAARDAGMLTIALAGGDAAPGADFDFVVPGDDPLVVQEVQETLYHVFWELVHVFLDREGS